MTYAESNWTRGELGDVPDRNPYIPCADCDERFNWQDYWKERIVEGDRVEDANDPDATWRCDECHERHERHRRRVESNQSLFEFEAETEQ